MNGKKFADTVVSTFPLASVEISTVKEFGRIDSNISFVMSTGDFSNEERCRNDDV